MHKGAAIWSVISFCVGSGLQISGWTNIYVASIFLVIALLLFAYAIRDRIGDNWPGRWIKLSDMGVRAYNLSRGTAWGDQIDAWAGTDTETKRSLCAHHVALTDVPLFGTKPPATRYEEIDKKTLGQFMFIEGGDVLRQHGRDQPPFWTNVSIRWRDQWKVLRQLRDEALKEFETKAQRRRSVK